MSMLTPEGRITVRAFAAVPTLADLPEIEQEPGSVSNLSSLRGDDCRVDLAEGCILTKSVKYTHQPIYWVNVVYDGDPGEVEYVIESDLKIIPYENFTLDDPCNVAYLEAFVHASLDLYAFIALTASSSTLRDLINMVKADNNRRQELIDETGCDYRRELNFESSSFTNPEYELVAIHPEHFLPCGSVLPVFHTSTPTMYVSARDRRLRESPDPDSPRLSTLRHVTESRRKFKRLNVFLVIMNAEIKFRRYLCMINRNPPRTPLPDDVLDLMRLTVEVVDLIYWRPVPTKGSQGETLLAERKRRRRNRLRPETAKSRGSSEREIVGDEEMDNISRIRSSLRHRRKFKSMDPETRRAYGRALMSGHDRDYDPALFEDAIPIDDSTNLFSENVNVEAWRQNIGSET